MWLKYYGSRSEAEMPRPAWVLKYLADFDNDEILGLSVDDFCENSDCDNGYGNLEFCEDMCTVCDEVDSDEDELPFSDCIGDLEVCEIAAQTRSMKVESVDKTLVAGQEIPPPPLIDPPSTPEPEAVFGYDVPENLIYGHDGRGRLLLDCVIAGQKCKALLDSG
jgi:hypothetical protein